MPHAACHSAAQPKDWHVKYAKSMPFDQRAKRAKQLRGKKGKGHPGDALSRCQICQECKLCFKRIACHISVALSGNMLPHF